MAAFLAGRRAAEAGRQELFHVAAQHMTSAAMFEASVTRPALALDEEAAARWFLEGWTEQVGRMAEADASAGEEEE